MEHILTEMVNNRSWNNFFHTRFNKSLKKKKKKKEHRSGCQSYLAYQRHQYNVRFGSERCMMYWK
jgi:sarcosine oxidase delta subunit